MARKMNLEALVSKLTDEELSSLAELVRGEKKTRREEKKVAKEEAAKMKKAVERRNLALLEVGKKATISYGNKVIRKATFQGFGNKGKGIRGVKACFIASGKNIAVYPSHILAVA